MQKQPQLKFYVIEYEVRLHGIEVGFFMAYDRDSRELANETKRHLSINDRTKSGVSAAQIHAVALKGGDFGSVPS